METIPGFDLKFPDVVAGLRSDLLDPRKSWSSQAEYQKSYSGSTKHVIKTMSSTLFQKRIWLRVRFSLYGICPNRSYYTGTFTIGFSGAKMFGGFSKKANYVFYVAMYSKNFVISTGKMVQVR